MRLGEPGARSASSRSRARSPGTSRPSSKTTSVSVPRYSSSTGSIAMPPALLSMRRRTAAGRL
ncbi:hypothetical protein ACFQXA_16355 [Nocardiopsis composta]